MSPFYTPGQPGLNIVIGEATTTRRLLVIEQVAEADGSFSTAPTSWGSDELGSLTEAERNARDAVLAAVAPTPVASILKPAPAPSLISRISARLQRLSLRRKASNA